MPPAPKVTIDPQRLNTLWKKTRELKRDPRFQRERGGIVMSISAPGKDRHQQALDTIRLFGLPREWVENFPPERYWEDLLRPVLEEVERTVREQTPRDLPGSFVFANAPSGEFGLLYTE